MHWGAAMDFVGGALRAACLLVFIVWTVRKSGRPRAMAVRWLLTIPVMLFLDFSNGLAVRNPFLGVFLCLSGGAMLALIWAPPITDAFAEGLASLLDSGGQDDERQPIYSPAVARRNAGEYQEAIVEIRKELERFPDDITGHLLLASIQAENLRELAAATQTIHRFCSLPDLAPQHVCSALYALADWHLAQGHDPVTARCILEEVITRLPDTEYARSAALRLAHLPDAADVAAARHERKFTVQEGHPYPGLAPGVIQPRPVEAEESAEVTALVRRLQEHPLDTEARERLAMLYAGQPGRLDWAEAQLEELLQMPRQPANRVAHWLNLLADVQLRNGAGYPTVRRTLQRIVDLDPSASAALLARRRINLLPLAVKGQQPVSPVRQNNRDPNSGQPGSSTAEIGGSPQV